MSDSKVKTAVVVGGNGKVGRCLVLELVRQDYFVGIVGSALTINSELKSRLEQDAFFYVSSANKAGAELAKEIQAISPEDNNHYLFNLAWRGNSRLINGSLSEQISNIVTCEQWITMASLLGCSKYISAGTLEERIVDRELSLWPESPGTLGNHKWYAFSKLYAAKAQAYLCYQSKIDHIQTQIGVVLGSHRSPVSYVDLMLNMLSNDREVHLSMPMHREPTTFGSARLTAKQLVYVAVHGNNLDRYRLGSAECGRIEDFLIKSQRLLHQCDLHWNSSSNENQGVACLAVEDIVPNLPSGAPTESLDQMLQIFFS